VTGLLSKLIAGGLSAGIVLVWWPVVFPHDGPASWIWRGIAWTLCSEVISAAFGPLEQALLRTRPLVLAGRILRGITRPLRAQAERRPALALAALAAVVLSVPGGLVVSGADKVAAVTALKPRPVEVTKVTRITKVVRPVERTVVRQVSVPVPVAGTAVPAAAHAPAAGTGSRRRVAQPKPDKPAVKPEPKPKPDPGSEQATTPDPAQPDPGQETTPQPQDPGQSSGSSAQPQQPEQVPTARGTAAA
jgi:hypothetical protein